MNTVLVVEDDRRVAELLQRGLEESGYNVSVTYDAEMGLRLFRTGGFDIVISDVILPGMNGFGFCKEIRAVDKEIPVIMLTALGTTDDKLDGFDAGADDYLTKPFDLRELDARIRALLKRRNHQGLQGTESDRYSYADLTVDMATRTVTRAGVEIKLTPKEFNLLLYMVRNPEKVLSRIEIAEQVWNTHFDTGTNFIDVYINYLRKKIDRDFEPKLIHTKPGMGFILRAENEDPK